MRPRRVERLRCIFCGTQCTTDCLPRYQSHYICHNQQCRARRPDPEATNAVRPDAQNLALPRPAPRNYDYILPRTPGSGYSNRYPQATSQRGTNRGVTTTAQRVSVSPLSSPAGSEPRRSVSPCSPPASPAHSYSSIRNTGRIGGGSRPGPNPTDSPAGSPPAGQPNQLRRRPAVRSRPRPGDETRDRDPHGRDGGGSRSNVYPRGGGDGGAGGTGGGGRGR